MPIYQTGCGIIYRNTPKPFTGKPLIMPIKSTKIQLSATRKNPGRKWLIKSLGLR